LPSFDGIDNLDVACNCSGLYYGSKCQEKINVCANETCSGHGACFENNSLPICKCYSKYEGDKCDIQPAELQTLKRNVTIASYLAFALITLCYGLILMLDLTGIFMKKERKYKKRYNKNNVYRYKYKNFDHTK
jgi:hypothetical protein